MSMTFTFGSLVSFLAAGFAACPAQPVSDTVVHRANHRVAAARHAEPRSDIVSEGPNDLPVRSLSELLGARVVLADGGIVSEGQTDLPARPLRELLGATVVLADGGIVTEGPASPRSAASRAVVQVGRMPARTR